MLIGELVKCSGHTKHTLRHYESLGLIYSDSRAAGSREYRDYRSDTLERLSLIEEGKLMGLTLKEIKPLLDKYLQQQLSEQEQRELVAERLAAIEARMAQLESVRQVLEAKLARLDS